VSERGPYKKGVVRKWHVTANVGDKSRCRYCNHVLSLQPAHKLSNGTQTFHWVGSDGERPCMGKSKGIGAPEHRPRQRRTED